MLKQLFFILVLGLFSFQGIALAQTTIYAPSDGQYQIRYPSHWQAVTDTQALELTQRQLGWLMPELKMEQRPDALFISGMTMASITTFRLPAGLVGSDIDTIVDALMIQHIGGKMGKEKIGENMFVIHTGNTPVRSHFFYASTIHNGIMISLKFAGNANMTNAERATYEGIISSLRWNGADKTSAVKSVDTRIDLPQSDQKSAGFWSGLWHGALVLPRWLLSWFMNTSIYAQPNTGTGYLVGFVIGLSMFMSAGGSAGLFPTIALIAGTGFYFYNIFICIKYASWVWMAAGIVLPPLGILLGCYSSIFGPPGFLM
jgi:hypothetical protein